MEKILGRALVLHILIGIFTGFTVVNTFSPIRVLNLLDHGTIPYAHAWTWQQNLHDFHVSLQEISEAPHKSDLVGSILILEHDPVYTLGTATTKGSGPFSPPSKELPYNVFEVERAGEATYHGPGQLVIYPILDLNFFEKDINQYLRRLEEVVIHSILKLSSANFQTDMVGRVEGLTGVWVDEEKIAAIGIKLRRWVTMHGVSVNVHPNMAYFRNIVPCGITDRGVTSLNKLGVEISLQEYAKVYLDCFQKTFAVEAELLNSEASLEVLKSLPPLLD